MAAWAVLSLPSASAAAEAASAAPAPRPTASTPRAWIAVPRIAGRLTARDLGLVINTADPYSVEVGEAYATARKLVSDQVLRVELPVRASLTAEEFQQLDTRIRDHFGPRIQALALAWKLPYAVACNSITGALALGLDAGRCAALCSPSRPSPYFGAPSARPFTELGMRPSMLLAARDTAQAKALIQRGLDAERSLGLRGAPPVHAHFVVTDDKARSVRASLFPPPGRVARFGLEVHLDRTQALENADRVLLYETGLPRVDRLDTIGFVPGALADHLTSYGGQLDEPGPQMSVLAWIEAGATASYGSVSEPCAHAQKFPHPQLLLLTYVQGATAIEAYWKSVAWPQQGLFVGDPLAAPFARR